VVCHFLQNVRIGKDGKRLDNDITFRFDFSLRDDATANSKLDQNTAFGTAGQKVIQAYHLQLIMY
jgi:hypothetical protein